jgi:hypothetical protein
LLVAAVGSTQVARADSLSIQALTLNTYDPSNTTAAVSPQTSTLTSGKLYLVVVRGTFSAFAAKFWNGFAPFGSSGPSYVVCGSPESAPIFASPGTTNSSVGTDAETTFARPWLGTCPSNVTYPNHYPNFQMNFGSGFSHYSPLGGDRSSPSPYHTYFYAVQGQGQPAQFRVLDNPSDDYGQFAIYVIGLNRDSCSIWGGYGEFKSQTDCYSYFSTGKSQPTLSPQTPEAPVDLGAGG